MLISAGCQYVIIGHSERRQYFGETDAAVCQKIKAALRAGLKPVLCIGETDAQRDEGKTFFILDKQVSDGLKGCGLEELSDLVLAYEPVWAIGTGKVATAEEAAAVCGKIREALAAEFGSQLSCLNKLIDILKFDIQLDYNRFSAGVSYRYNSYIHTIDYSFVEIGSQPALNFLSGIGQYRERNRKGTSVIDCRLSYQLNEYSKVNFLVNNVTNLEYQTRPGWVMPPRTYVVQLSFKF